MTQQELLQLEAWRITNDRLKREATAQRLKDSFAMTLLIGPGIAYLVYLFVNYGHLNS